MKITERKITGLHKVAHDKGLSGSVAEGKIDTGNIILSTAFGSFLIITGLTLPSGAFVELLRTNPTDSLEQLLLGATIFKVVTAVLGLYVIVLGRMPIWTYQTSKEKALSPLPPLTPLTSPALAVLGAMLFAASLLRLYGLNFQLWYDEILTHVFYVNMPFGDIVTTYDDQNQHFLFTILAHASFLVFGESAWSLRLPAALFGVGSIFALFLLVRQVGSTREALLSAALLTFSYHHIWFSQNARGYTGLLFWTILSSWLLVRGLKEKQPRLWIYYAAAAALGVYTHMTMLFVVMGHFIIYLITLFTRSREVWPARMSALFAGFFLAGLVTLELYSLVLPQLLGGTLFLGAEKTIAAWKNPLWTLVELTKGMEVSFKGSVTAVAALVVFAAGFLNFARKEPLVVYLLIIPALVGAAVTMAAGHPLWPRFFFFTMGFGVLVVVRGAFVLGSLSARLLRLEKRWGETVGGAMGTVLCAGIIMVSSLSVPLAYYPKQDYLGALAFVEESKEPGDTVVTLGFTSTFPYKRFYKTDWEEAENLSALNSIRSRSKRTWVLYTMPLHLNSVYPEVMASIERDFKVVKRFYGTLRGGTIFVCRADTLPT